MSEPTLELQLAVAKKGNEILAATICRHDARWTALAAFVQREIDDTEQKWGRAGKRGMTVTEFSMEEQLQTLRRVQVEMTRLAGDR